MLFKNAHTRKAEEYLKPFKPDMNGYVLGVFFAGIKLYCRAENPQNLLKMRKKPPQILKREFHCI